MALRWSLPATAASVVALDDPTRIDEEIRDLFAALAPAQKSTGL